MKKRTILPLFLGCSILLLFFCFHANVQAKSKYMGVKTAVNLKKKPAKKSKNLDTLQALAKVFVPKQDKKKWLQVKYKGKKGYVMAKYLSGKRIQYITKGCPAGRIKSYMDYRRITNKGSKQYKLQKRAYTDKKTGIRMFEGRYCIAVGSYYTREIGKKIDLLMQNGSVVECVLADMKADKDTINHHRQHATDGSVAEFVVDTRKLPKKVKRRGDVSYVRPLKGKIKKMRIYK